MPLEQQLRRQTLSQLQGFIALLDDSALPNDKESAVAWLQAQLLDKRKLAAVWAGLDPLTQKAITFAVHNDGEFVQQAFRAQYGALPGRPSPNFRRRHRQPILFDLFTYQGRIPSDLIPMLADLVPPPQKFRLRGREEPPEHFQRGADAVPLQRWETAWSGWQDMLTYLRMIADGSLKLSRSTGAPTPAGARNYARRLSAGDFFVADEKAAFRQMSRPFAIHTIANSGGLVGYQQLTAAGKQFLETEAPPVLLEAFETWVCAGQFDELRRIPAIQGQRRRQTRLTAPAWRRELLVEALSWCPTDGWIAVDDFLRALDIWQFEIPIEEDQMRRLSLDMDDYRRYGWGDGRDYQRIIQGSYIKTVLWEFLGGIGALDLAAAPATAVCHSLGGIPLTAPVSRYDGLLFFRINPLGAYLFGQAQDYESPGLAGPAFMITEDGMELISQMAETPAHIRLQLEKIGEQVGDGRFRLTTERLLTAVEGGLPWADLYRFLENGHGGQLPPALRNRLVTLAEHDNQFRKGEAAIFIHVQDAQLMTLILADEVLSRHCLQVDENRVVIPAARERAVRARLKTLSYILR